MFDLSQKTQAIKLESALYVVATPIGNLGDITLRALQILASVDFVICEDTRISLRLLEAYKIKEKKMLIYNDHSEEKARENILRLLIEKKSLALISDAGTPLISDPGYKLISYLRTYDQRIIPLPGPSSLTSALCASGLPCDNFLFLGFLPTTRIAQKNLLKSLPTNFTFAFFESANRVTETLESISETLGERRVCAARELTKIHEEIVTHEIKTLQKFFETNPEKLRGEFVIIVEKAKKDERKISEENLQKEIKAAILAGESIKDLSQNLADIYGIHKKEIYQLALKLTK
ncbi:MAG: 16S rRNA (cytidine(1402)-2'-O)-methyltransferase [Proteobacteria bacterium]|nr:16S rRNA (cytidine(1402)-2'-O)-methyltransferase [Pseudomonadota bacterium]